MWQNSSALQFDMYLRSDTPEWNERLFIRISEELQEQLINTGNFYSSG